LLSTTDSSTQRGQTLVIFALALVTLLGFAALAFDLGQAQLDRRSEQNGADAAALAGARYIVEPACFAAPSLGTCSHAVNEAMRVAYQNGYGSGPTAVSNGVAAANGSTVTIHVPPVPGSAFQGQAGYIEVQIGRSRPSIFAGVLGIATQRTGVLATASNRNGVAADLSMLALNKTVCQSANFGGNGVITVGGNIQVDSNCSTGQGAFNASGTSTVDVTAPNGAIDVVGTAKCAINATCSPMPTVGQPYVPDPFIGLPVLAVPAAPSSAIQLLGTLQPIPGGCPGSSNPATAAAPATCTFGSSYAGTTWVLSPGYYPGGLSIQGGTVFLRPGVFYIGGGGLNVNGTGGSLYSISALWAATTPPSTCSVSSFTDCGGVLIYNTNDPSATSGGSSVTDIQQIQLNGSSSQMSLYPIQNAGQYTGIVIFEDRNQIVGGSTGDLTLVGNGSNLTVVGAIYVPSGTVKVNGTGNIGTAQIIADQFQVGGGGTLGLPFNPGPLPRLQFVGLVE
jgi:Putative Flp pilus-assembly TadE/G-like